MVLNIHEVKNPDRFTNYLLGRISEHLKGWELCVLTEKNISEGTPESVKIMHNTQAAKLFDIAYELNIVLEEYDRERKTPIVY